MLNMNQPKKSPTFELDLIVKDAKGNPTNMRKSIQTDSPRKLCQFWHRYQGKPKRRKKKSKNLPNAKQAEQILRELYKDDEE